MEILSQSVEETYKISFSIGKKLKKGDILCFFGDLGAGKTTFIKGLAAGAAQVNPEKINSPTFSFLNIYEGTSTIYHFDLYRLRDSDEFLGMGFDEYFYANGITCIEWSEKIESLIPSDAIRIELSHLERDQRKITITNI